MDGKVSLIALVMVFRIKKISWNHKSILKVYCTVPSDVLFTAWRNIFAKKACTWRGETQGPQGLFLFSGSAESDIVTGTTKDTIKAATSIYQASSSSNDHAYFGAVCKHWWMNIKNDPKTTIEALWWEKAAMEPMNYRSLSLIERTREKWIRHVWHSRRFVKEMDGKKKWKRMHKWKQILESGTERISKGPNFMKAYVNYSNKNDTTIQNNGPYLHHFYVDERRTQHGILKTPSFLASLFILLPR